MNKIRNAARIVILYAYMPLMIVYMETLLRTLTDNEQWAGFPYSILFALTAGFLINLILSLISNPLISRITGAVLLGLLCVVFALQYFMFQSFKVYMPLNSVFSEATNVAGAFTDTLVKTIYRGIPVILCFFAPLFIFILFNIKRFPLSVQISSDEHMAQTNLFNEDIPDDAPAFYRVLSIILRVTPVTIAAAGIILTVPAQAIMLASNGNNKAAFRSEYNFNTTSSRLGVLTGVCLDAWYGITGSPLDSAAFIFDMPEDLALKNALQRAELTNPDAGATTTEPITESIDYIMSNNATADLSPAPLPPDISGQNNDSDTDNDAANEADTDPHPEPESDPEPEPESESEPEPVPVEYGYNVLDIDFESLIESESDSRIRQMHEYVSALTPSKQNAYTGLFEGKNLIIICAEAFTKQVADPLMTPTLYRLIHNGIYFSDFYQPTWGGGTAGGEYAILSGFPPTESSASTLTAAQNNCSYMIGNRLRNIGYFSAAYHNGSYIYYNRNETHEFFGYDTFQAVGHGIDGYENLKWSGSDVEMFQLSIPHYINNRPFSVYYMTVSAHSPYNIENSMANRHWDAFPVQFEEMSDTIRAYMAANLELEYALEHLLSELESAGILNDTVIVLATDHYPYGLERSATWETDRDHLHDLFGHPVITDADRDSNALILWSGCLENENKNLAVEISSPASTLDILPTLLNLFGLEFDSRLFVGRDVFSDAPGLVFWFNRSWKTDLGYFDAKRNEYHPASKNITLTDDYTTAVRAIVNNKINYANSVLSRDYFSTIFNEDGTIRY